MKKNYTILLTTQTSPLSYKIKTDPQQGIIHISKHCQRKFQVYPLTYSSDDSNKDVHRKYWHWIKGKP